MDILDKFNLQNRFFLSCLVLLGAILVSCSSTSDSSSDDLDENSSDSRAYSSSQLAEGPVTDADFLDVNSYDNSEITKVVDSLGDMEYSVVTLGVYMWLGENVNKTTTAVKNTCYGYDDGKCGKYGKLYKESHAEEVCPQGFRLPSVYEWDAFLSEREIKVFAGQCSKKDTLECFGLDSSARYLARNDSAVIIKKDGSVSVAEVVSNDFYSIRCVRRMSIVTDFSDLPKCEKNNGIGVLFVGSENQGYACSEGKWTESTSRTCLAEEKGTLVAVHDSLLYACDNGNWTLAQIDDVDENCDSKSFEREVSLNGVRYACSDTGWIRLKFPGSELGYCSESAYGKTAMALQDSTYYSCDSTGWRMASLQEIFGTCDSTRYGKSKSLKGVDYVCRFGNWDTFTSVEKDLGSCSVERAGEALIYESQFFVCDTSKFAWKIDDAYSHIGKCDSTRYFDTVVVGNTVYLCNDYNHWQQTFPKNGKYYLCTSANLGKIENIEGDDFICKQDINKDYVFDYATSLEKEFGYCTLAATSQVVSGDSVYFCSSAGNWRYYGKYVPKDTVSNDTAKKDSVRRYPIDEIPECNYYTRDSIYFNGLNEYICNVYNDNYHWILYSEDSVQMQNGAWVETVPIGKQTWYRYTRDMRYWNVAVGDYDPSIYATVPEPTCAEGFHLSSVADWEKLLETMNDNVPGKNAMKYFADKTKMPRYFGKELRADHNYWTSDEIDEKNAKCMKFKDAAYSVEKCVKSSYQYIACVRDED